MKFKPKGRKIYRYRTRGERLKGFFRNTGAVVGTVAAIAAIGFVGFSAGAPILKFLEEKKVVTQNDGEASSVPDATAATESDSVQPQEEATEAPVQQKPLEDLCGYYLPESALTTESQLRSALTDVPAGTTHIVVPLKTQGGFLHYASALDDVRMCGAVVSALPAETICSVIRDAGYVPGACINALEDSVYPRTFSAAGYQTITGEKWLYSGASTGAAPMLSPFSVLAEEYLAALTGEISEAGFEVIICQGLVFPEFSEEDLAVLDTNADAYDRYTGLEEIAGAMRASAGDAMFLIEVDGQYVLDGKTDILTALDSISEDGVILTIDDTTSPQYGTIKNAVSNSQCVFKIQSAQTVTDEILAPLTINGSYFIHPGTQLSITAEPSETASEETETASGTDQ